ncbi:response regulator transcription factor [Wenyingzhuangia sp. 2_MG-2023]|uniref:response regulator transcription factor n=1 Tax=Wenyingzhuangia sp. 2_MG-2023 TaxID=3062639 RepID=UPI0026E3EDA1|nr:response regulator transcription factor [Wenyingzhuangia sp. 2_MG-2023]MDO6736855.1 response regulator transcription factor [Wenyingzhuangia sp. 2_MG-2023]
MKILVIEDEPQLLQNIKDSLEKEQFLVETASDYYTAIDKIAIYEYDCVLLDIMLPNGNGLNILNNLKKEAKGENVIIISAKDALDDKLKGLSLGADDYLTKPFHLAELNARVKVLFRRKTLNGKDNITYGNLKLEIEDRLLFVNQTNIPLNRKEFDILNYFLLNRDRLITRTALAEHVWGDHIDQVDNFDFVYSQIKNIRKKLQISKADLKIESVYGIGYKIVEK